MAQGSSFTTTYAVYASSSQYAGTYQGQVKYLLTHPNSNSQHLFMQDVDTWGNSVLANIGDSIRAIDIRDGKQYWVTRLADGNIWMTQNLDFDIKANTVLDSNTTDLNVAYDSSTGQYAEYSDGYTESNGVIYYTPASSATTIDFAGTNVPGWRNSNTAPYTASKTDSTETGHASLGNYYNWTAAIASNDSSSLTQDTISNISQNPKNSICPKGWRLPTISSQSGSDAGSTNEFVKLVNLYGNTPANIMGFPLWFTMFGYVDGEYLERLYTGGYYWSSTVVNAVNAYRLSFNSSTIFPSDSNSPKLRGWLIRCVAK